MPHFLNSPNQWYNNQGTLAEGEGSVRLTSLLDELFGIKEWLMFSLKRAGHPNYLGGGQSYPFFPFSKDSLQ